KKLEGHSQIGTQLHYLESMTNEEKTHIHFEEVAKDDEKNTYYISDNRGYILYVTEEATTASEAAKKAYSIIKKIHIPKMIYRNDIGNRFDTHDLKTLEEWGYLSEVPDASL